MSELGERMSSAALTLAAIIIAGALVKREVWPAKAQLTNPGVITEPVKVDGWASVVRNGTRVGNAGAPVVIAEFADLQCPFCKRFLEETYLPLSKRYGDKVSLVVVEFPLNGHKYAKPGARAAACAERQGRYAGFVQAVFKDQDKVGVRSWSAFAKDAGMQDMAAFDRCVAETGPVAAIDSGLAIARRLSLRGTPTVMINGWRFPLAPDDSMLSAAVERVLAGREPFDRSTR